MPYFYQCKVITSYTEMLLLNEQYEEALKIIISNYIKNYLPLCMFSYKDKSQYLFKEVSHLPHFALLCILDNPEDTITIYYVMRDYLSSVNSACKKPSHLKDFLSLNDEDLNIKIELLKKIIKHNYLAEFLLYIKSRKDVIKEQLAILDIIKTYDPNFDTNSELEYEYKEKLTTIENTNFVNEQKISISKDRIKKSLSDEFKLLFTAYTEAEYGNKKYEYYKYNQRKEITYQSSDQLKEEKLENIFRLVLKEILFSSIGVINSINENIIHNHLNDTLRQPLIDENIFAQISHGKYEIEFWSSNKQIQKEVITFSKQLNNYLKELRDKIRNTKKSENAFFNFDYDNLFKKSIFYEFLNIDKQLNLARFNSNQFLEHILQYVLKQIRKEIKIGRERLKKDLSKKISSIFLRLEKINNKKFQEHLGHAKENIENTSITNIVSWFSLNETLICNNFQIQDITNTLIKEYPELKKITISTQNSEKIKGEYFINFHNIFYIILHNIIIHSNIKNNTLLITFKIDNEETIINSSSLYKHSESDTTVNRTGLNFLKNNLININKKNTYNTQKTTNNFNVELQLQTKDIFS